MTRIKICGITNRQDAQMSADAGADALGFIGVPGTARYVIPEVYGEISEIVPLFVKRVVVVHRPEDADEYLAEYVQHYADTTDKSRFRRGAQWRIRAFRMRDAQTLQELADYPDAVGAVLLDAYHKASGWLWRDVRLGLGGAGQTADRTAHSAGRGADARKCAGCFGSRATLRRGCVVRC
jgi:phosphoribosylanthranilate isomerase